jgi:hypothetical protein
MIYWLADGYTLTHLTGYAQLKREWLAQIDSGRLRYHSARPYSASVEFTRDTAVLVGRDVVDGASGAAAAPGNLPLTTTYERRDDEWIAVRRHSQLAR